MRRDTPPVTEFTWHIEYLTPPYGDTLVQDIVDIEHSRTLEGFKKSPNHLNERAVLSLVRTLWVNTYDLKNREQVDVTVKGDTLILPRMFDSLRPVPEIKRREFEDWVRKHGKKAG